MLIRAGAIGMALALTCSACGSCSSSQSSASCGLSGNLIVNGGGEAAPGSTDGKPVPTPGWTSTAEATAIKYGASGGYPKVTDPGPADRGLNFLGGGANDAMSSLVQTIDVSRCGAAIDNGTVSYGLSGWLGGWQGQDDNAVVTVGFQDAAGGTLGTATLGPVLAADRSNTTGFVQRSTGSGVPKGTRTLQVTVAMTRTEGSTNDAYLDDLSLVLREGGAADSDSGAGDGAGLDATVADSSSAPDSTIDSSTADAALSDSPGSSDASFEAGVCDGDTITSASIDAAWAALAGGATSVNLSPNGCIAYARSVDNGLVTSEKLTYAGQLALSYTRSPAGTTGQGDFDLDGYFEWAYSVVRGDTPSGDQATIAVSSPATKQVVSQKTYTWTSADLIHVIIEEADSTGALHKTREYDTPRAQASPASGLVGHVLFAVTTSGCTPAEDALLRNTLRQAMDGLPGLPLSGGLVCLHHLGAGTAEKRLIAAYAGHDVVITCDSSLGAIAQYDGAGWFDTGTVDLQVNPTKFGALNPSDQVRTLFHEMLHELGEHDPEIVKALRVDEIDPTEACAQTCWPTSLTTQCSCATCLHTNICDPRCAAFKPCNPDMGFTCPCPPGVYYTKCSDCLADCPSGLFCAFHGTCNGISVSCSDAATCP
jgi:hypothetical protein